MSASLLEKFLLLLADLSAVLLSFVLTFWVYFHSGLLPEKVDLTRSLMNYQGAFWALCLFWMFLFAVTGLYRKWLLESRLLQLMRVGRAISFGCFLILCMLFGQEVVNLVFHGGFPGVVTNPNFVILGVYWLAMMLLVSFLRILVQVQVRFLLRRGFGMERMLVLGANSEGKKVRDALDKVPQYGHRVIGFLDERHQHIGNEFCNLPLLGKYADLQRVVRKERISGVIICHSSSSHNEILRILVHGAELPVTFYVIPDLYDVISGHFKANLVHGVELMVLFALHMPPWQVRLKRLMDIFIAGSLFLTNLPLMLLAALAIRLDGKGPIFYTQERVGLYGKRFRIIKFRTMRIDAEKAGPQWATRSDPRITRLGHWLRILRIDELPQLWCVLTGDMSMVGPRPEREHFIEKLRGEIPLYISRLKMKPGLTGWAQVRHHYDTTIEDVQQKLKYDLYYFENMSIFLDLQILVRTVWVVLTGKGAQ